jgi:hypothetical protein
VFNVFKERRRFNGRVFASSEEALENAVKALFDADSQIQAVLPVTRASRHRPCASPTRPARSRKTAEYLNNAISQFSPKG